MAKISTPAGECHGTEQQRPIQRLRRSEFPQDTIALARFLLGKIVVREFAQVRATGRIVETEAYLHDDPACHAHRGATPRNRTLFLRPGHAYIYLCYGTSFMLNVSSAAAGVGEGVLVRALEPLSGIDVMRRHRGTDRLVDLARGPGRLAAALRIDLDFDGVDLLRRGRLWLGGDGYQPGEILSSGRIGLTKAADLALRFYIAGNRFVSGPRAPSVGRAARPLRAVRRS